MVREKNEILAWKTSKSQRISSSRCSGHPDLQCLLPHYFFTFSYILKYCSFDISRCFRGFRLWSTEESFVAGHGACVFCFTHIAKKRWYLSHYQRVSLRLCPDNSGGIGGQYIHPTHSEFVITMFWYSKT